MATSRDILLNSTPTVAASSSAPPSTVTHALSESPSIVPSDAIKTEGIADLALEPELARVRFEAFREFATGRRRRELAAKASSGAQTGLNNNVQQLRTALNLVEKCLCAAGWCIQRAIELARETSTRPSELTRASKLLDEFDRAKPVMTPAKQFGVRVRETLAAADLKPSKASAVMHLALSTVYRSTAPRLPLWRAWLTSLATYNPSSASLGRPSTARPIFLRSSGGPSSRVCVAVVTAILREPSCRRKSKNF
jgi:hypothetical protein